MLPLLAALGPIIGKVIGTAGSVVDQLVEDKDLATKLKTEIKLASMNIKHDEFKTEIEQAGAIIRAEVQSGNWLAANWRPMLMCLFGLIIFNNYVLYPYLSLFFAQAPMLEIPADMWSLLKIGVGGYVTGRSMEKGIKLWRK